jgi:ATP-binding cassette subfamily G (WHITE) protein 2
MFAFKWVNLYRYTEDLMKYSWGALMINQWEENDPLFLDGRTVLEEYDLKDSDKWGYLGLLVVFFTVFFTLAFLALSFINHSRR